jgi:hypothetical protein
VTYRARLDRSFPRAGVSRPARKLISAGAMAALCASPALGQMFALPVLQNAFSAPGASAAANYGTSSKEGNTIGGAASWAPASNAFQLSGGIGRHSPETGKAALTYAARISRTFKELASGSIGLGGFVGAGVFNSPETRASNVPFGVSVGYRRPLGSSRGFSAFASPYYSIGRVTPKDLASVNTNAFRVSGGVDVALARSIGLTVGVDAGKSTIFGVGMTYALGRR